MMTCYVGQRGSARAADNKHCAGVEQGRLWLGPLWLILVRGIGDCLRQCVGHGGRNCPEGRGGERGEGYNLAAIGLGGSLGRDVRAKQSSERL